MGDELPRSPALSEHSSVGGTSSTSSCRTESPNISRGSSVVYRRDSATSDASGTITAMIEPSCAGCLPGDILPLKISVDHIKPIKAMQGIIVTLYRQGRVDTSPTIPLGPSVKGQKQEYEYYPKSLTGLGGLSLSSAGSSRLFRQDLNQTFTPLIIDPRSLTAIIKISIQVPESVFPTVSSTPGAMISFKYYLEVVIDLRGKPINQDRFLPRLGMVNVAPSHGQGDPTINGVHGINSSVTSGFCSLDTSQMRREKGVVSSVSEVIVGTRDSNRKRSKQKEKAETSYSGLSEGPSNFDDNGNDELGTDIHSQNYGYGPSPNEDGFQDSVSRTTCSRLVVIPPAIVDDEVDEKTRLKRAEEHLLPSAPPEDEEPVSSASSNLQPSAPTVFATYSHVPELDRSQLSAPEYDENSAPAFTTTASSTTSWDYPEYRDSDRTLSATGPQDDKQERERHRLQMAASSPDDVPDIAAPEQAVRQTSIEPTAPAIEDDYPIQYYGPAEQSNSLPLIERVMSNEKLPVYKK